jgi:F-type H+-transporting ATPase subunit alpha
MSRLPQTWLALLGCAALAHGAAPRFAFGLKRAHISRASLSCTERTGLFNRVGDLGATRVTGSLTVNAGEMMPLGDGLNGLVLYQRNEFSYLLVTPVAVPSAPGSSSFAVSPIELKGGLTLNWKGQRVCGPDAVAAGVMRAAYGESLAQKDRASPRSGMLTGLTAIDVLAPLGRGQSMMVVGPEDSTASDLCLDVLLSQQDTGVSAIYVAMRPVDEMATIATQANCVAVSSSSVGEFAASVAAACALGEAVRDTGKHVCIVVDDMQPLRTLWTFMQDTESKMYAEDGVTTPLDAEMVSVRDDAAGSELRTFYSSVLERAGVRSAIAGGGSQTLLMIARKPSMYSNRADADAFPLAAFDPSIYPRSTLERVQRLADGGVRLTSDVLAKLGISSPGSQGSEGMLAARKHIDECISLADGHLQLDERLVRAGVTPAIDVRESLSRIGLGKSVSLRSTPMAAAIRQLAPRLRLELAVASDALTAGALATIDPRIFAWRAVLQQRPQSPRSLAQNVIALFCARGGHFDALSKVSLDVASAEAYALIDTIVKACPSLVSQLHGDYELTAADELVLQNAILAAKASAPLVQRY